MAFKFELVERSQTVGLPVFIRGMTRRLHQQNPTRNHEIMIVVTDGVTPMTTKPARIPRPPTESKSTLEFTHT